MKNSEDHDYEWKMLQSRINRAFWIWLVLLSVGAVVLLLRR